MELKQLEMFIAVVEEESVNKAADRVCRTQPAVSMALRKLEQEIGAPLFDRSQGHDYLLTQAGEVLYDYATRLLALRDEAVTVLEDLNNMRMGRLRVGANESISFYLLPKLTQVFHERHPQIKIEVMCQNSEGLLRELKQRKLDLALLSYIPEDRDLETQLLMRDELVLITSPKHPFVEEKQGLAARRVHIRDLGKESIIAEEAASPWRKKMAEAFLRFNVPLNITVESAPIETIKKMVAMGMGVAFVPLMCIRGEVERGELAVVEVEGFRQERTLWAVRRRIACSHAALAFMEVVPLAVEKSLSDRRQIAPADRQVAGANIPA